MFFSQGTATMVQCLLDQSLVGNPTRFINIHTLYMHKQCYKIIKRGTHTAPMVNGNLVGVQIAVASLASNSRKYGTQAIKIVVDARNLGIVNINLIG